jgi:HSP20 family protein
MTLTRRPNIYRSPIERFLGDLPWFQIDGGTSDLAPPLDVREIDDAYVVEVDLPGVDATDIELLVEGRTLTIRGQVREEDERRQGSYLIRERRQGQFMRAVALPGMVDVDGVSSRFENGRLTIILPKAAQNRARRIDVPGGQSASRGQISGQTSAGQQSASQAGSEQTSSSGSASGGSASGGTDRTSSGQTATTQSGSGRSGGGWSQPSRP